MGSSIHRAAGFGWFLRPRGDGRNPRIDDTTGTLDLRALHEVLYDDEIALGEIVSWGRRRDDLATQFPRALYDLESVTWYDTHVDQPLSDFIATDPHDRPEIPLLVCDPGWYRRDDTLDWIGAPRYHTEVRRLLTLPGYGDNSGQPVVSPLTVWFATWTFARGLIDVTPEDMVEAARPVFAEFWA